MAVGTGVLVGRGVGVAAIVPVKVRVTGVSTLQVRIFWPDVVTILVAVLPEHTQFIVPVPLDFFPFIEIVASVPLPDLPVKSEEKYP